MARVRFLIVFIGLLPAMLLAQSPRSGRTTAPLPAPVPTPIPAQTGEGYGPASVTPPAPVRELRGAWMSAVATNADWPSKPGVNVAAQKAELIALLNRAVQLKFNAVFFQVRPSCDALYASPLEPWSEYLTGTMGRAPQPFYDPLAFAIEEAHKRGLELHAWLNPFRASRVEARSPVAPNHVIKTHPAWVRRYGEQYWLDPGEPAVREHVVEVVLDVVRRYDVDGVVFDDYFYPYPIRDAEGRVVNFPDDASWRNDSRAGGLARDDWRRQNVSQFVQKISQSIKAAKPWVKFGVSPFGIWRPGFPWQIKGLSTYTSLYADSRLWLTSGWLDYFSPQLYWPVDSPQQSFPILLNWWTQQNVKGRNVWPSLNATAVGKEWSVNEIARQMAVTRRQSGASGEIFYHLRTVVENQGLADLVRAQYGQAALVPASPWLAFAPPAPPRLTVVENGRSGLSVRWERGGTNGAPARLWLLQYRINQTWGTEILPAGQTARTFENSQPELVAVSAVDRLGNVSVPAAIKKTQPVSAGKPVPAGKIPPAWD
jgi:uncharacterized lipoprotein YddW (UPF0748 family)